MNHRNSEKFGYSLGDAAANLVFQMMMIFQLKFYTDVFGLDGAVAGSILMIASFSAIIVDPAVGILSDRTSTRWGKFRPWIMWTAIPFCLFYGNGGSLCYHLVRPADDCLLV